jgi:hypothetical protein
MNEYVPAVFMKALPYVPVGTVCMKALYVPVVVRMTPWAPPPGSNNIRVP